MTKEDKEAIIRRLEAMYGEAEDNETKEALFYATEALKEQRPHGEWIETDDGDEIYDNYKKCTNCGESIISTHMSYCGNCGAKMGDKKDDLVEIIEAVQSMKEGKRNEQTTD